MRTASRNIVVRFFAATLLAAAAATAQAQGYPTRPVRVFVALAPGSATDVVTRLLAARLSDRWGQPVVVENRAGGAGAIAGGALVKSDPDGHTLMTYSDGHAVNAALNAHNLPYDTLKDMARVSQIARFSTVLVASSSLGVSNLRQLVDRARTEPGRYSFGSAGVGGGLHLSGEMFNQAAAIQGLHVPYKGTQEALADTIAGRVHYMFAPVGLALPHIQSGKLVPLAVGSARRSNTLPDVPTVSEAAIPGFEYELWAGMFAPAGTPRAVLERIAGDIASLMASPDMREQMAKAGFAYEPNTAEDFDRLVRTEVERLARLGKAVGIRLQ